MEHKHHKAHHFIRRAGAQAAPEQQRRLNQGNIMILHQKHPQPVAQHSLHEHTWRALNTHSWQQECNKVANADSKLLSTSVLMPAAGMLRQIFVGDVKGGDIGKLV